MFSTTQRRNVGMNVVTIPNNVGTILQRCVARRRESSRVTSPFICYFKNLVMLETVETTKTVPQITFKNVQCRHNKSQAAQAYIDLARAILQTGADPGFFLGGGAPLTD